MADAELSILVKMKNEASSQLKEMSGEIEAATKSWNTNFKAAADAIRQAGVAMLGIGAAISGSLGLSVKAAEDERVGISQLSQALRNAGEDYDYLKGEIEGVIAAQQSKTNYSDGEQREALSNLIYTTQDYQRSMEQLPLVMDLAAGKGMDLSTASEIVGRVMQGNTSILTRYGIQLKEGATATEALQSLTEAFGGSAEAMASPFTQIKNVIGDLSETIGSFLLPVIRDIANVIIPVIEGLRSWAENHSTLTRILVIGAAALGVILVGLGTLAVMVPMIINLQKAWIAVQGILNIVMSANPIGLIILAIGALIAIVALLIANWQKVKDFFYNLWQNIKILFAEAVKFIINYILLPWVLEIEKVLAPIIQTIGKIVGIFKQDWGEAITEAGDKLANLRGEVTAWADGIEQGAQASKDAAAAQKELASSIDEVSNSIETLNSASGYDMRIDMTGKGNQIYLKNLGYDVPAMASGGVVTKPTLALIGESGPEAVVPLNRAGKAGQSNQFNISQMVVRQESDIRKVANELWKMQNRKYRGVGVIA